VLVSHTKQFIFTKTVKTAGTSVESYFERYCMPDGEWRESHTRDECVSENGIIGYRGGDPTGSTWYNHMPAKKIRELVGQDVWNRYYKFTVIRNPFDKLISAFYLLENTPQMIQVEAKTDIERFRSWVRKGGLIVDRDKYLIDEKECVDYFIRFEHLLEGIKHVCDRLSVSFEPSRVPEFKKGIRPHRLAIRDYYDCETEEIVQELYAWEFRRFGYNMPN
jgi:hypothetical protein